MSGDPDRLTDAWGALAEELRVLLAAGAEIDRPALAARFAVDLEAVVDCHAAVAAFQEALGEDLPSDLLAAAPPNLPAGYELVGELGRGGMGVVYRAHHQALGRDVALKVLRPGEQMFGDALARFRREAKSLARLRHPHIVTVHDVGEVDGCVFYTMDLVQGRTLGEVIADERLGITRTLRILTQVARAVDYAHGQGVIHRDLKPSNILIDADGEAFVVDFGLARDAAASADAGSQVLATRTGQLLGTPAYMSPEQARGDSQRIGETADVYALGAILYECLTGRRPFGDRPLAELIGAVLHEEPERPGRVNPKVPRALEVVCGHAMHKDPVRRYPTAHAFADDLERFADGRPILAAPPGPVERGRLWLRRRASHVATAILAVMIAVVATQSIAALVGADPDQLVAQGKTAAARGEHGVARRAFLAAADSTEFGADRLWLEALAYAATAERLAELRRLGQMESLEPLVQPARRRLQEVFSKGFPTEPDAALRPALFELRYQAIRADAQCDDRARGHLAESIGVLTASDGVTTVLNRILRDLAADTAVRQTSLPMLVQFMFSGDEVAPELWSQLDAGLRHAHLRALADGLPALSAPVKDLVFQVGRGDTPALAAVPDDVSTRWAETVLDPRTDPPTRLLAAVLLVGATDLVRCSLALHPQFTIAPTLRRQRLGDAAKLVQPGVLEELARTWLLARSETGLDRERALVAGAIRAIRVTGLNDLSTRDDDDTTHSLRRKAVAHWLWRKLGGWFATVAGAESWWEEHGNEDPRKWLVDNLEFHGMQLRWSSQDRESVQRVLDTIAPRDLVRAPLTELLRRIDMAEGQVVSPSVEPPRRYRLHLGLLAQRDADDPFLLWEESRDLALGDRVELAREDPLPGVSVAALELRVPGYGPRADLLGRTPRDAHLRGKVDVTLTLLSGRAQCLVATEQQLFLDRPMDVSTRWQLSDGNVRLDPVGRSRFAPRGTRHWHFAMLSALEPIAGESNRGSGLDAWRRRVADGVEKLARRDSISFVEVLGLADAAIDLRMPQAQRSLARQLRRRPPRFDHLGNYRLVALGCREPDARAPFTETRDKRAADVDRVWLLRTTELPAVRVAVLDWLGFTAGVLMLDDGPAWSLRRAVEAGEVSVGPGLGELLTQVDDPGGADSLTDLLHRLGVDLLAAIALLAASLLLWPLSRRRRKHRRDSTPAAMRFGWFAVLLATALTFVTLDVGGWQIPAWAVYLTGVAGALAWARGLVNAFPHRRRTRFLPAAFCATALVIELAAQLGVSVPTQWCAAFAVLAPVVMGMLQDTVSQRAPRRSRRVATA